MLHVTREGGRTVYTANLPPITGESYEGEVRYASGFQLPEITVSSNSREWGNIPIYGINAILALRDALVEICERERLDFYR